MEIDTIITILGVIGLLMFFLDGIAYSYTKDWDITNIFKRRKK